jgi:hypothetical protein
MAQAGEPTGGKKCQKTGNAILIFGKSLPVFGFGITAKHTQQFSCNPCSCAVTEAILQFSAHIQPLCSTHLGLHQVPGGNNLKHTIHPRPISQGMFVSGFHLKPTARTSGVRFFLVTMVSVV